MNDNVHCYYILPDQNAFNTTSGILEADQTTEQETVTQIIFEDLPSTDEPVEIKGGERNVQTKGNNNFPQSIDQNQKEIPLTTKTSKALNQVLGNTPDVYEFERLQKNLKRNIHSQYCQSKYEIHVTKVQTSVLKVVSECKNAIKDWDKNFVSQTGRLITRPS